MKTRGLLLLVLGSLGAWGCPGRSSQTTATKPEAAAKERPPVILITVDTLRPDHTSVYHYRRDTTPRLAEWAAKGAVFDQAYTYWPKTRGSFVAMMTGRTAGESGYSPKHPELHAFNPTLAETLPGFTAVVWFGLFAPSGTPRDVVVKINNAVQRILADRDFRDRFLTPNLYEPMSGSPEQFAEQIHLDAERWQKVIRDAKLAIAD